MKSYLSLIGLKYWNIKHMFSGAYISKTCTQSVHLNCLLKTGGDEVYLMSSEFKEVLLSMKSAQVRRSSWWGMQVFGQKFNMRVGFTFNSVWALRFCFLAMELWRMWQWPLRIKNSLSRPSWKENWLGELIAIYKMGSLRKQVLFPHTEHSTHFSMSIISFYAASFGSFSMHFGHNN